MISKIEVVHTWRDYSFSFKGELDVDDSDIGAIVIMRRESINEIYEIRHLRRQKVTDDGILYHWIKDEKGEYIGQMLGETTEELLLN